MDVRPIASEQDYDWALQQIAAYFEREPAPGTPEADRFSVLASLIGAYEDRCWPIQAPDPIDALRELMQLRNLKPADLGRLIGSRSRATELLSRKRNLTMEQAWKLHSEWRVPAELLLRPTTLAQD